MSFYNVVCIYWIGDSGRGEYVQIILLSQIFKKIKGVFTYFLIPFSSLVGKNK